MHRKDAKSTFLNIDVCSQMHVLNMVKRKFAISFYEFQKQASVVITVKLKHSEGLFGLTKKLFSPGSIQPKRSLRHGVHLISMKTFVNVENKTNVSTGDIAKSLKIDILTCICKLGTSVSHSLRDRSWFSGDFSVVSPPKKKAQYTLIEYKQPVKG